LPFTRQKLETTRGAEETADDPNRI